MFLENIREVVDYKVGRYYFIDDNPSSSKLNKGLIEEKDLYCAHDMSLKGRGMHIIIRVKFSCGLITTAMVASKTKVNPPTTKKKKRLTIPRGELLSGKESLKLGHTVATAMDIPIQNIHLYGDSTIALAQIRKAKVKGVGTFKTFVANCTEYIIDNMSIINLFTFPHLLILRTWQVEGLQQGT